jgi:hypothetical protein
MNDEITPEEAREEYERRQRGKSNGASSNQSSILGQLLNNQIGWLKGGARGAAQSIGDIGASIGNLPAQGVEHFTGKRPYSIPHPQLLNEHPTSFGESFGQKAGKNLPRWAIEAYLAHRIAPIGGRNPLLRIGAGGAGGAGVGYAANEENRASGAGEGLGIGLAEGLGSEFPLFARQATKGFRGGEKGIGKHGIEGFHISPEVMDKYNHLSTLPEFASEKPYLDLLLGETAEGKYTTSHHFQSHLKSMARDFKKQGKNVLAKRVSDMAHDVSSGIRERTAEAGHPEIGEQLQRASDLTRRHYKTKPYVSALLKSLGIGSGIGGGAYATKKIYDYLSK